jgi:hypothetical protein
MAAPNLDGNTVPGYLVTAKRIMQLHAELVYKEKYEKEMTLDEYMEYLNKGLNMLRDNVQESSLTLRQMKALRIALEFKRQMIANKLKGANSFISGYIKSLG